MPLDIPPQEIIEALEAELDAKFVHFIVSQTGEVTGIFQPVNGDPEVGVGFEAQRSFIDIESQMETVLNEMDDMTLLAIKDMLQSVLEDLAVRLDNTIHIEPDVDANPAYDDWFTP